ncbi:HesA/MoeB/ThiF family protein [Sphingomonas sp. CFBP 13720]|uniref:HesA/MoeB/ThiF family protein n=1 Tax=Sphingomonas sp. CFBP 13720 TaxID=2775302 RepID=UPI00177D4E3B|nr:molybdopterin-synthase adenylyltransferase MoeB [Sphingomonas sp. CFBP 13720]MBD8679089.1 molybdopterin-synthase adenylyltransferase MoeB [Sphingomonas sp. CFBP 13720]
MNFSDAELDRYARHLVLREVGGAGQAALKAARVVVIGAGGIGSPALQYLAAGGVGTLVVVDDDVVDASNLQRQTLFGDGDIGRPKVAAAMDAIARINPFVTVDPIALRIDANSAPAILRGADVVVDGCDNFATRLAVADAALKARVPLVSAAVGSFEGQLGVFRGWEPALPCYRCLVGDDPDRADVSCADQGVLGALTGVIGSMAALEAMRAIVGFGDDPAGKLLIADLLAFRFRTLTLVKDPGCRCAA